MNVGCGRRAPGGRADGGTAMGDDMAFRLKSKDATVADGVRRIARGQITAAIAKLDDPQLPRADVIHEVRKHCKKVRGLLRLVAPRFPHYARENARFRNAARMLSATRDADVLVTTYDTLEAHFGRRFDAAAFEPIRARLVAGRRQAHEADATLAESLAEFRRTMVEAEEAVKGWRLDGNGAAALRKGIAKSLERGQRALKAAHRNPNSETMHDLRKRAKDTWYQTRLLRDLWPGPMQALASDLSTLADLLGDEHDLAVFQESLARLADDGDAGGANEETIHALSNLARERRRQLQASALALSDRVFAGEPSAEARRIVDLWKAWRRAPGEPSSPRSEPRPDRPDHLEIERKFRVVGEAWRDAVRTTLNIRQGYLCETERLSLRVRIVDGNTAVMTAKSAAPDLARTEIEFPIPLKDAEALMALSQGHVIEKVRHIVSVGAQRMAVDVYGGSDSGTVVAEVELDDAESPTPAADWLGEEVTGDPRFYAAEIARAS